MGIGRAERENREGVRKSEGRGGKEWKRKREREKDKEQQTEGRGEEGGKGERSRDTKGLGASEAAGAES